jgi:hypothetical protein
MVQYRIRPLPKYHDQAMFDRSVTGSSAINALRILKAFEAFMNFDGIMIELTVRLEGFGFAMTSHLIRAFLANASLANLENIMVPITTQLHTYVEHISTGNLVSRRDGRAPMLLLQNHQRKRFRWRS